MQQPDMRIFNKDLKPVPGNEFGRSARYRHDAVAFDRDNECATRQRQFVEPPSNK